MEFIPISEIISFHCSIFPSYWKTKEPKDITIEEALMRIKSGLSLSSIEKIQSIQEKDERDKLKKNLLPCILFSGTFTQRKTTGLKDYSYCIVLDFDKVIDVEDKKKQLMTYPFVVASWKSPSGNGVKALVALQTNNHLGHFLALENLFPDVDGSGKDVSRICFESSDPNILVADEVAPFTEVVNKSYEIKPISGKVIDDEQKIYAILKAYASSRGDQFIEGNRNYFIMKMSAALNRTGVSENSALTLLSFDYGNSGFSFKELSDTVKKVYRNYVNDHNKYPISSIDEVVKKDQGGLVHTGDEIHIFDAEITVSDLIRFEEVYDNLVFQRNNGVIKGESTFIPELDRIFLLARGEVTVIHGYGNHGKSSFEYDLLTRQAVKTNKKVAIFGPESYPAHNFYKKIIQTYVGKSVSRGFKNSMTDAELEDAKDFVNDHFFYIYPQETPSLKYILARFKECIIRHKVDFIVIDPWNQLDHFLGKYARDDQYLGQVLSDLKRFAQNEGVYLHVLAHPTKPTKTKDGLIPVPTAYDLSGGAMWNNKADNIICYNRPDFYRDPTSPIATIITQKIKEQGVNGELGEIELAYERDSYRFYSKSFMPEQFRAQEAFEQDYDIDNDRDSQPF